MVTARVAQGSLMARRFDQPIPDDEARLLIVSKGFSAHCTNPGIQTADTTQTQRASHGFSHTPIPLSTVTSTYQRQPSRADRVTIDLEPASRTQPTVSPKGSSGYLVGRSHIQPSAVEVDGVDEVLLIAEAASGGLDPLNP